MSETPIRVPFPNYDIGLCSGYPYPCRCSCHKRNPTSGSGCFDCAKSMEGARRELRNKKNGEDKR